MTSPSDGRPSPTPISTRPDAGLPSSDSAIHGPDPRTDVPGFLPVLQPMWPAGIGGQYAYWDDQLKAYLISEPTRKNNGFIRSPDAHGSYYTPAHMLFDA